MKKAKYYYCLCLFLLCLPLQSFAKQKILVIESYHSDFDWDISYKQGIKSVLKNDFELHYFEMDTKRLAKHLHTEKANQAWEVYQQLNPDLVILGDDSAVKNLSERFQKVATPVIYLGVNNNPRHYNIHKSKNISGVLERPLLKRAIPVIAQVLPYKVNRVLVMFDNSLTAHTILQEVFSGNTQLKISGIEVDIKHIGEWSDWQNILLNAADNNYDAVILGLFHTLHDNQGKYVSEEQIIEWSSKNTPLPPFGFWEHSIGQNKNIEGLVIFGHEQGKIAAEMAREVLLNNVQPYQISAKTAEKGRYLFSRAALQKYGLILPENIAQKTTYID